MQIEMQRIRQYKLQQRLGRDVVGEIWRAYDTDAQRPVILKLYRTHLPDNGEALAHYIQTIERVAALHHPNIATIYDVQELPSRQAGHSMVYVATEYVEGGTFADYIKGTSGAGKMPPPAETVQLFSTIALTIDTAHQHGIIHGNLKPTNILLKQTAPGRSSRPMLTDFGSTKLQPYKHSTRLPFYLAPEQIKDAPDDERSDIYALGVLLYELYTGVPPFRGNRPIAVMMQHLSAQPTAPDLVNPSISPVLAQIILRSLAKDPLERFPGATFLAAALAQAHHLPVSEELLSSGFLPQDRTSFTAPPTLVGASTPSTSGNMAPAGTAPWQAGQNGVGAGPGRGTHFAKRQRRNNLLRPAILIALILLLLSASVGTFFLLQTQQHRTTATPGIGHAFFINSGQLNRNSNQGINDELQIDLSNIPDPAANKSYYAWLLGDTGKTEAVPILIGRLTVNRGKIHLLYAGDKQHANLLGTVSRFLINEDDTKNPSSNPLLNQDTWRYYAVLPQTPDPADKLHFSMLDHLRHLIVESPELAVRGLHGGLAFWFVRDTATISDLTNSLADDWQKKDANAIHNQIIRILDYLDGTSAVNADLPSGTPVLADRQLAQLALLGPAPQAPDPPGYVYQNEVPPGYVYLLQLHINGAVLSPQTTPEQRQSAIQINGAIDNVRHTLTQIYQDAKQLVHLTNAQLLQPSSLALLDDMATQAQYAYTGQVNPTTGTVQGGALWIYNNLQQLAAFNVVPYKP